MPCLVVDAVLPVPRRTQLKSSAELRGLASRHAAAVKAGATFESEGESLVMRICQCSEAMGSAAPPPACELLESLQSLWLFCAHKQFASKVMHPWLNFRYC